MQLLSCNFGCESCDWVLECFSCLKQALPTTRERGHLITWWSTELMDVRQAMLAAGVNNKRSDGWIPYSFFSLSVHVGSLSHCHGFRTETSLMVKRLLWKEMHRHEGGVDGLLWILWISTFAKMSSYSFNAPPFFAHCPKLIFPLCLTAQLLFHFLTFLVQEFKYRKETMNSKKQNPVSAFSLSLPLHPSPPSLPTASLLISAPWMGRAVIRPGQCKPSPPTWPLPAGSGCSCLSISDHNSAQGMRKSG